MNLRQEGILKFDEAWCIPEYLEELLTGERPLAVELIHLYLHDSAIYLSNLNGQILRGEVPEIMRTLHTLKGSCRQIGGLMVGDILEEMETTLRTEGIEAVRGQVSGLRSAFGSLRSAMEDAVFRLTDSRRGE